VVGLFGVVAAISFWAERRPERAEPPPIAAPVFAPAPAAPARDTVADVLARFDGQRDAAARYLGISRTTLWRRLKAGN
jgi:propionate catabolism operon transcriptional regulator